MNTLRNRFYGIIGVVGLALTLGAAVAWPFANPTKITWSPDHLAVTLCRSGLSTLTATFTSDQTLQNVALTPQLPPVIARFITVEPSSFLTVPAGQPQTVRITINLPNGIPASLF